MFFEFVATLGDLEAKHLNRLVQTVTLFKEALFVIIHLTGCP